MFSELWQRDGSIPRGSAAVLVPSPHLAQQVRESKFNPHINTYTACVEGKMNNKYSLADQRSIALLIKGR